jgi:hypothetical protein
MALHLNLREDASKFPGRGQRAGDAWKRIEVRVSKFEIARKRGSAWVIDVPRGFRLFWKNKNVSILNETRSL